MNWTGVVVDTIAAFGLGLVWFSPMMFGKSWAAGSHNIQRPASPPAMAMVIQFVGIAILALVVGTTETGQAIITTIGAILTVGFVIAWPANNAPIPRRTTASKLTKPSAPKAFMGGYRTLEQKTVDTQL